MRKSDFNALYSVYEEAKKLSKRAMEIGRDFDVAAADLMLPETARAAFAIYLMGVAMEQPLNEIDDALDCVEHEIQDLEQDQKTFQQSSHGITYRATD